MTRKPEPARVDAAAAIVPAKLAGVSESAVDDAVEQLGEMESDILAGRRLSDVLLMVVSAMNDQDGGAVLQVAVHIKDAVDAIDASRVKVINLLRPPDQSA